MEQQTKKTSARPVKDEGIANSKKTILVIGGTGKTGRRIVERLTHLAWPVRKGSRSSEPKFDWLDTRTWKPALQGIDYVYISFQPDLAVPGSLDAIRYLTKTAIQAGVTKLVLLSGRGEKEAEECEQVVMNSGVAWTILRASWFCQNFSEGFLESLQTGHLALPVGDVGEPFIDVDDIADVAVAALTEDDHTNQLYELTGPRLLTFRNAVKEIADAIGRPISFEQISATEYVAMLEGYGVPADQISLTKYLLTEVMDGRNASVTDGFYRALGRKPTDFSVYIKKTMATGVWG